VRESGGLGGLKSRGIAETAAERGDSPPPVLMAVIAYQ